VSATAEKFARDGFVIVENLLSLDDIVAARTAAAVIIEHFTPTDHPTVFSTRDNDRGRDEYFMRSAQAVHCFVEADALADDGSLNRPKDEAINKIGHALHDLDPTFRRLCKLPCIGQLLRDIGYDAPRVWQTMYICKPPRVGGEVRWHQDASYLHTTPASVTGIWIALEDATRDNGCLWVQPGGQRSPLREIFEVDEVTGSGTLRPLDATPWPRLADAVPLEVKAGTAVLFNDHLPHYSSHNHSDRSRHAFALHVAEANSTWSPQNWLQRSMLRPFEV